MYLAARNYPLTIRYSVDEMFPLIKKAGYDGLEFCLTNKMQMLRPDTIEDFYRRHVRDLAEENDLRISMVSCHPDNVYDEAIFAFEKKAIPRIRDFGTDLFLIGTNYNFFAGGGTAPLLRDDPQYAKKYRANMKELLALAADHGVRLVVEPEPNMALLSVSDYFSLYEDLGSSNLFYNFDVGHAFLTERDVCEAIRLLGKHIVHTHYENVRRGEHWHRLPLDGDIDLQQTIRALDGIGYDGAICVELHAYDQLSEACVKPLRRILDEVSHD